MEFLLKNIDKVNNENYIPIILVILTVIFGYCIIKFWIPFFKERFEKPRCPEKELENLLLKVEKLEIDETLGSPLIQDETRSRIFFNGKKQDRVSNAYTQIMNVYEKISRKPEEIKTLTIDYYDLEICNSTFGSNIFKAVAEIIKRNHVRIIIIQSDKPAVRLLMVGIINCIKILTKNTESSVVVLSERPKD